MISAAKSREYGEVLAQQLPKSSFLAFTSITYLSGRARRFRDLRELLQTPDNGRLPRGRTDSPAEKPDTTCTDFSGLKPDERPADTQTRSQHKHQLVKRCVIACSKQTIINKTRHAIFVSSVPSTVYYPVRRLRIFE